MKIDLVYIKQSDGVRALLRSIDKVATVAVIMAGQISAGVLKNIASAVLQPSVRLVSIYGEQSEELHDLVDVEALQRKRPSEVITTWDKDGGVAHFVHNVWFAYRGVLKTSDLDRGILICYASDHGSVQRNWKKPSQP